MKKTLFIVFGIIIFISNSSFAKKNSDPDKTTLSGKITDKQTGESIPGVSVYIPDLKTGGVTDAKGTYKIENLPKSKVLVQVKLIGYKLIVERIDLAATSTKNFALETSVTELNEIVITGLSQATEKSKTPTPILTISPIQMKQIPSTNVIDAIAKQPGINAVTTGPNVSKPYIRGLGFNRVLTLYDGVRQEGQQWGDEHGIEIDENAVSSVEVVKGPSSLTYGSDALAGVVNLLPPPFLPVGKIKGELSGIYQTNNKLIGGSGAVAGNSNGIVWGARFSHKQASDYQNKIDGRVYGTKYNETDANGFIGINKSWGYSHLKFSVFDDIIEIPDGSRDSLTRKFTIQISEEDTVRPIAGDAVLNSYTIATLHQRVQHYSLYSSNSFAMGPGKLGLTLGYQQSVHREFSHPVNVGLAGLYLVLPSYTYDLKYFFPETHGWETTIGVNGMYQINTNKGTEFIIPNYNLFDFGPFAFTKKTIGKLDISVGVRYDSRSFKNDQMFVTANPVTGFDMQVSPPDTEAASIAFPNYKHTFSGVSGSFGATYNFTEHFLLKANIARGFRAPNIAEISANGVHPGTNIYQVGNLNFKPEFSLQEDVGIMFSTTHVTGGIEFFNNDISNYIYNEKILNSAGQDSTDGQGNTFFQFQAAKANLYGGEASIDIHPHPLDWLHFENAISVTYGVNKGLPGIPVSDSAKYLPFIPPLHTLTELRANFKKKLTHFASLYVKAGMEWYAKQDRAYLAFNTETPTPGYTLFDVGIGGDVTNKDGKVLFSINILGNNITDVAYQAHLNRLKYFEEYSASPNGHLGIYNMGRNISFKLIVPIDFKK